MRKITVEQLKNYYPTMDWESEYSDLELEKLYYEVYRENKEESYRIIFENRRVDEKYKIYLSFLEESESEEYLAYFFNEIEKIVETELLERIKVLCIEGRKDVDKFADWLISHMQSESIDRVIIKLKSEIDRCTNNEIKECLMNVVSKLSSHAK